MLEINNLKISFIDRTVLSGINLSLRINSKIAILGETGSGKTVLLETILGFQKFANGTILLDNKKLSYNNLNQVRKLRSRIGYISQNDHLLKNTTVYNQFKWIYKLNESQIVDLTSSFGLADFLYSPLNKVSKLAIWKIKSALATINSQLIFIDDPLSALTINESQELIKLLYDFIGQGNVGILLLTSSKKLISEFKFDTIFNIDKGVLV